MEEYLEELKRIAGDIQPISGFSKTYDTMYNEIFPNLIKDDGDFLEVGVFRGKTTVFMGKYLEKFAPGKKLFTIDPHSFSALKSTLNCNVEKEANEIKALFLNQMKKNLINHVHYSMTSKEGSKEIKNNSILFVFIDADHTKRGVINDFNLFFPKMKLGGIMCFDDYKNGKWVGVKEALNEVAYNNKKLELIKEGTREVYFRKVMQ